MVTSPVNNATQVLVDNISIGIYPNPVQERRFTFELNNGQPSESVVVRVTNAQGAMVFEANYKTDSNGKIRQAVQLPSVASCLYFVNIISSSGLTRKVFVE